MREVLLHRMALKGEIQALPVQIQGEKHLEYMEEKEERKEQRQQHWAEHQQEDGAETTGCTVMILRDFLQAN